MARGAKLLIAVIPVILIAAIGYTMASDRGGIEVSTSQKSTAIVETASAIDNPGSGRVMAPDFRVKDIEGNYVSLSDYRGRPVIIWFMAAWCPSCVYMANIISQAVDGRDDVVVIMVDIWSREFLESADILGKPGYPPPDTVDKLREFRDRFGKSSWIPVMDDGRLVKLYNVKYIDTVFVVDRDGFIVFGGGNVATVESLRAAIGGG